eukprot:9744495-Lingulodinium_polyedra.AAC.1
MLGIPVEARRAEEQARPRGFAPCLDKRRSREQGIPQDPLVLAHHHIGAHNPVLHPGRRVSLRREVGAQQEHFVDHREGEG